MASAETLDVIVLGPRVLTSSDSDNAAAMPRTQEALGLKFSLGGIKESCCEIRTGAVGTGGWGRTQGGGEELVTGARLGRRASPSHCTGRRRLGGAACVP